MTIAEKIAFIESQCFSDSWSLKSVEAQLSSEQTICFVREEDGDVMGFVLGTEVCGEAELYRIAVLNEHRRKGVGEQLMSEFLSECNRRNAEKVFLEVRSRNAPAIALYKKSGFEEISVRKHYYNDDDAVIFAKNL